MKAPRRAQETHFTSVPGRGQVMYEWNYIHVAIDGLNTHVLSPHNVFLGCSFNLVRENVHNQ